MSPIHAIIETSTVSLFVAHLDPQQQLTATSLTVSFVKSPIVTREMGKAMESREYCPDRAYPSLACP